MKMKDMAREILSESLSRWPSLVVEPIFRIEDRTGYLTSSLSEPFEEKWQGKDWLVLPATSVLNVRRWLWEKRPKRAMLIIAPGFPAESLQDLLNSSHSPPMRLGAPEILRAATGIPLPGDERLGPLLPRLIDLRERARKFPTAGPIAPLILSILLGSDLMNVDQPREPVWLARIAMSRDVLPKEAFPFVEEFLSEANNDWRPLMRALLIYEGDRRFLTSEILRVAAELKSGQLPISAELTKLPGGNDRRQIELYGEMVEEAIFAEPIWGKKLAREAEPSGFSKWHRCFYGSLKADIERQIRELLDGNRESLDTRAWREHLFADELQDAIQAAENIALLKSFLREIRRFREEISETDPTSRKLRWVEWYAHRCSQADLIWMSLDRQLKKVPWLAGYGRKISEIFTDERSKLNMDFGRDYVSNYKKWLSGQDVLTVAHILRHRVKPLLGKGEKVLLLLIDGMSYPVWRLLSSELLRDHKELNMEEDPALSLLPTITGVSRRALFVELNPKDFYPDLIEDEKDEKPDLTEEEGIRKIFPRHKISFFRRKDILHSFEEVCKAISEGDESLIVVILNEIDETLRSTTGSLVKKLDEWDYLPSLFNAAIGGNRTIVVTSDHGFTPSANNDFKLSFNHFRHTDRYLVSKKRYEPLGGGVWSDDLLYDFGGSVFLLTDFGASLSKLSHNGYHGGASLEEVIVPCAVLQFGRVTTRVELKIKGVPGVVREDDEIPISVEICAQNRPIENVRVKLSLPPDREEGWEISLLNAGEWRSWNVTWRPQLPSTLKGELIQERRAHITVQIEEPHELRGVTTSVETRILPRKGKTVRAVDDMLPDF
jgi:hypothetical protein